ncbi:MAG TPA: MFS transporter [Ktedonobacterales bacterium]|nr:MFS transporter [Ktedonobacterales bacterium]
MASMARIASVAGAERAPDSASDSYLRQGTRGFRRASAALVAGAFITYAVMYCTQPLLPAFTHEFHISPAEASLSISVTTGTLAICMLLAGSLSEAWGRKPVMTIALFATALLAMLSAFAPTFSTLLVIRAVQGIVLAGVPAIAMAYLSEEVYAPSLGYAMGMMIGGNAIGGMTGRISIGILTDISSWRIALAVTGLIGFASAVYFWRTLPPSRHFAARPLALGALGRSLVSHLQDPGLRCLYGIGFLLMGSFVTLYNYIGFALMAPPYHLSQSAIGWIFALYLVGTFASTWMGHLADRLGRRRVLWIGVGIMLVGALLTLAAPLVIKIFGLAVFTFGFFSAHSIASSWIGRRALHDKAQASALYLFTYYVGGSIGGTVGGLFWAWGGWASVIGMIVALVLLAAVLTVRLAAIHPLAGTAAISRQLPIA